MLRRTWLMAVPAVALIAAVSAQGCSTKVDEKSEFANVSGLPGNGFPDGSNGGNDSSFGEIPDGGYGNGKDASWDGTACATARAEALRLPIYMQIVLDGSGSMDGYNGDNSYIVGTREKDPSNPTRPALRDDGSTPRCRLPPLSCDDDFDYWRGMTGKKWLAARGALDSFAQSLARQSNTTFGVGLLLFSSTDPGNGGDYTKVDVAINKVDNAQVARIQTRINPKAPGASEVYPRDSTPLFSSISGQGAVLASFDPTRPPTSLATGGKRVLVVITDGVPTRRGSNTQQQENDSVIDAVESLRTGNPAITTFIVGVGNSSGAVEDYDEQLLGAMAFAGGAPAAGCNPDWTNDDPTTKPCHFQITPGQRTAAEIAQDFTNAMNSIRDIVVPCDFPLEKAGPDAGATDPERVNVVYEPGNGGPPEQLPRDPANGWVYNAYNPDAGELPSKVTLNGTACTKLKGDAGGKIRIVLGCKTGDPVIIVN